MRIEKKFEVRCSREAVVEIAARDETLLGLFADAHTEIVVCEADRKTTRTHYTALGRSGTATFHFTFLPDAVRFEKVCDGRVWRELCGTVSFVARGKGTRVLIEADGRTKSLVPEFTIRGPMKDQIEQMASALRRRIRSGA